MKAKNYRKKIVKLKNLSDIEFTPKNLVLFDEKVF